MSMLVEVRKRPRVVDGKLVKVGDSCHLPNSLAVALEDKGMVGWPTEKVAVKAAKVKSDKRKAKKAKAESKSKGK